METVANDKAIFRMPPQDWKPVLIRSIVLGIAITFGLMGAALLMRLATGSPPPPSINWLCVAGLVPFVTLSLFWGNRIDAAKLSKLEVEIGETDLTYRGKTRVVTLSHDEITQIIDSPIFGLIITTRKRNRGLIIPPKIAKNELLRTKLSAIKPIQK